jgi:hypothetical protein
MDAISLPVPFGGRLKSQNEPCLPVKGDPPDWSIILTGRKATNSIRTA